MKEGLGFIRVENNSNRNIQIRYILNMQGMKVIKPK